MAEEKRKTHTSSEVKRRYNAKAYARIGVELPKDLVAAFKEKCQQTGISQAAVVKEAVERFLAQ